MKRYIIITLTALALAGCAGSAERVDAYADKGRTALYEAAEIVEASRCKNRIVDVLAKMIDARGPAWAAGYFLSCPDLKPLMEAASKVPTVKVE